MNIVEKEGLSFAKTYFRGTEVNSLQNLKSRLTNRLYNFNSEKDKLGFLSVLRPEIKNQVDTHRAKCRTINCKIDGELETGLFAIDQEIESISQHYVPEVKNEDKFSVQERTELYEKLNTVLDKFNDIGLGQEILFDEINELKDHFELGKKNWFKLVKGKLFDLTAEKIIDAVVFQEILKSLADGLIEVSKQLK